MQVARALGMTLGDVLVEMTREELTLWAAFFELEAERHGKK
jgi:hypothetical protein